MTSEAPTPPDSTDIVFGAVRLLCNERGIDIARCESGKPGVLAAKLKGSTREWELLVDCQEGRMSLPAVGLLPPRGLLPHVSYHGGVCVNDGQGLSIDPDRREDIAGHTLLAAYDLLEKWSSDEYAARAEFMNELEGYWNGLPGAVRGQSVFEVDGTDRLVSAYEESRRKQPAWYFAERGARPRELNLAKLQPLRALYVHLDRLPDIPAYPDQLAHDYIDGIRSVLSPSQLVLWDELVGPSKNGRKANVLLVSVPRQAGGRSLVGAAFATHNGEVDRRVPLLPLTARRQTAAHMRERGGASLELLGKHVAILGCGAVGSVVADTLAAAGVGKLTLVDADEYSEDNVFRHVLDPAYIGFPKTWGLKHQLERRYPGLTVDAVDVTAQHWLARTPLTGFDGVVLAFGAPSVERSFARAFRSQEHKMPVVFTWLEALDLGGHSVLMWTHEPGCLDCLYRDEEGTPCLHPRTSFLEPNQHVTRNLTGCASVFVPYGALQARKTGHMAAEQMLGALVGTSPQPAYHYWAGDGTQARAQGLQTTAWWSRAPITTAAAATEQAFGRPCKRCRGDS
ncbi:MAG: ThiF family adenylyltransferase [Pseudohongiella sp.]|nr:ThiF family adenylyltransferase [Pseudohongiella sp.]